MGLFSKLFRRKETIANSITDQEVIDIAGNFIQKNKAQITKELKSPKSIVDPVIIYTYDGSPKKLNADNKSGANYAIAHSVEVALEQIIEFNKKEGKSEDSYILLLGRFGFDGDKLEKSGLFEYINRGSKLKSVKYPKLNITFMTAHASKGLGCLSHISEKRYYGINVLADVLRGANSKRITDAELDKLPEYGKLNRVRRDDLITTIEWLIENHFILKTKHPRYPVLHPTYEGMHYDETITTNKLKKLQNTLQKRSASILS